MSQKDSEEKKLPASNLKLKKQREKGRIAKSPEMYSAVTGAIGLGLLLLLVDYEYRQIVRMFDAATLATSFEWEDGFNNATVHIFNEFVLLVSPVIFAILTAVIIANLIYNKGIPFSFDPLIPKFERLNPLEGLKRIFGKRGLTDAVQKIIRLFLWFSAVFIILFLLKSSLFNAPLCGYTCTAMVGQVLLVRLIIAAIIVLLIIALLDMPIQKALFLHEMKMGHSEKKREDKDQYGAPEIRSERKRVHREILLSVGRIGVETATFILIGESNILAIQYLKEKGGVPYVVDKAQADKMQEFRETAKALNLPEIHNDELVKNISHVVPGTIVPPKYFNEIAMAMVQSGNV